MTERELQDAVVEMAQLLNWKCAYFRPAQTTKGWRTPVGADGAGWPDLFMVKPGRALAVELKAGGNKPAPHQVAWLEALTAAGVEADVWDDRDWLSGHIEAELRKAA